MAVVSKIQKTTRQGLKIHNVEGATHQSKNAGAGLGRLLRPEPGGGSGETFQEGISKVGEPNEPDGPFRA